MITLGEALRHPSLAAAEPLVHTGQDRLDQAVRWVHSSEVPEIAHLLRGGELLLTGGLVLASTGPDEHRRYVRRLAARQVVALAVETGPRLPGLPEALLEEARDLGFPVVELRRVVPFIEVAESINSLLVNESVRRLSSADAVSHALSAELARGAGPQELLAVLARFAAGDAVLVDEAGAGSADEESVGSPSAGERSRSVPVAVHGVTVARLVIRPDESTDPAMVDAILDRAPEALGLALLRTHAPSAQERAVRELMGTLRSPEGCAPHVVTRLARAAGLSEAGGHVVVAASGLRVELGAVDAALRLRGRRVLSGVEDGELCAVVALPAQAPHRARQSLLADLRAAPWADRIRLAVGPVVRELHLLPRAAAEAQRSLKLAEDLDWVDPVIDAQELALERLADRIGPREELDWFVTEELGELLRLEPSTARRLVETLDVYFRCGCSKSETARRLHLQRQSLYQRLGRIFDALGGDPTGTPRAGALHTAARLYGAGFGTDGLQRR